MDSIHGPLGFGPSTLPLHHSALKKERLIILVCDVIKCLPMTVGSRSTKTALGTCLPAPVSEKKVLKESSPPPIVLSEGIWPSGWIPCSKLNNDQEIRHSYFVPFSVEVDFSFKISPLISTFVWKRVRTYLFLTLQRIQDLEWNFLL